MQAADTQIPAFKLEDLRTIEALAAELPSPLNLRTLRRQMRDRAKNGLASACVRLGRHVMISKSRYEQWLATRAEVAA